MWRCEQVEGGFCALPLQLGIWEILIVVMMWWLVEGLI
jgi:hypothetical protein